MATAQQSLDTKLADMLAKQNAKYEEMIKKETMKHEIMNELDLTDDNFSAGFVHAYKCDCHIEFRVETLGDAIVLAEKMNPENTVRKKKGSLSFVPFDTITEAEWAMVDEGKADIFLINPWRYVLDQTLNYPTRKTLVFYVKSAGYMVEVRVDVAKDPDNYIEFEVRYDRHGNPRTVRDELHTSCGNWLSKDTFWSPPGSPRRRVMY